MHISSSYAKILGEKLFRTWEILRSGSKAKNGEKEKTLAIKSIRTSEKKTPFFFKKSNLPKKNIFFLHISSSYAKILGEKLFCTWEVPRSGSKAEDGEAHASRLGQKLFLLPTQIQSHDSMSSP